jgi:uncharacterized protein
MRSLIYLIFITSIISQVEVKNKSIFSIGDQIEFYSEVLEEKRIINVYLPNSYSKEKLNKYPVIYLLDGSAEEDFIHISGLVQFGSFSWINMIPETIVIGVSNVDRMRDFTSPTKNKKDKKDFPRSGQSERFIKFIESELQSLVDRTYRTNNIKTIIGQSLGGLLASEILYKKPELFNNYIIVSPSLWWDDESFLTKNPKKYLDKKSIYIAVGKEGKIMERVAKELYQDLDKNINKDTRLFFNFFEKQSHGDALHLAVYDAFEKIFKK